MSRLVIDLRGPVAHDLPDLEFELSAEERLKVEAANVAIDLHVMQQNERDKRKQG